MRSIKRDFKQSGKQKKDGRVLIKQGRGSRMKHMKKATVTGEFTCLAEP